MVIAKPAFFTFSFLPLTLVQMTNTNPARGMRDFLPGDVRKREFVIGVIKEVYEKYGFEPLETPSIENLDTLTNKYGDEGNQLMFKILKRGEKLQQELAEGKVRDENQLSDLALRYDLTVPLARVVANYRNDLPKFFKRYQIQPVWRADRPAKGRFREFYQCDVDSIGSTSLVIEAEQIAAVCEVLDRLGFGDFQVLLNHRMILSGVLAVCGVRGDRHADALVAIDKISKIGVDKVLLELEKRGFGSSELGRIREFLERFVITSPVPEEGIDIDDDKDINVNRALNEATLEGLDDILRDSEEGRRGVSNLREIIQFGNSSAAKGRISVFPSLARGLSYYTGAIFEVGLREGDFNISLGGGGRYDGLIGMFGKEDIPACGFSLGLERILVVMEERGMFPADLPSAPADVMVTIWNEESANRSLKLAGELRAEGLRVLVYPKHDKLGKQFKYADQIGVPVVCVLGDSEIEDGTVSVKNMKTGEQKTIARAEAARVIGR